MIKNYVIDRITGMLKGIGKVGEALSLLFKGDFSGAWDAAKSAASMISGHDAKSKAFNAAKDVVGGIGGNYKANLAEQTKKEISSPKGAAGVAEDGALAGLTTGGVDTSKVANDITTGGTRNTSITLNISKFWEDVNVYQAEDIDMSTLTKKVLEAVNRSLEAATAAAR